MQGEMRIEQVKNIRNLSVLDKILFVCLFAFNLFYINALSIAIRLRLISRVLKKVHSDHIFTSFLITLKRIFGGPCCTIFSDVTLFGFL